MHAAAGRALAVIINLCVLAPALLAADQPPLAPWRPLPPLPDLEGFGGMFAGTCGRALVAAGGANFPDRRPWEGGAKRWYDTVWLLDEPGGAWRRAGRLPRPTAYGASSNTPSGVVCAGGGDADRHFEDVYRLTTKAGQVAVERLPPLPRPCAFMSGATVGDTLYLAGGLERPDATACLRTFWALDLRRTDASWRELEPCPGPERMLAVAGSDGECFYLFSGAHLRTDTQGRPVREYLRDAWRYRPGSGWRRLADLPRAAVAAPAPALHVGDGRLLILSGDDGTKVHFQPILEHPGFARDVLAYVPAQDSWTKAGEVPFSRATAPTAKWRGMLVVVSGEARPGFRSPEVWTTAGQSSK
jgi:N-acetylneuraminate epimerase